MASAALELQGAIVAALKADTGVSGIVGDRVFDYVPRSSGSVTAEFPFVAIADFQELTEDADCIPGAEIFVTIDVWSRAIGKPEAHRLASAVKAALTDLTLTDFALVMLEHDSTRTLTDPDGLTTHAVLTFRAFVEQP